MKVIDYLKEFSGITKRSKAKELQGLEANIAECWKEKWEWDIISVDSQPSPSAASPGSGGFSFESWLTANVAFLSSGAKYNKRMNFIAKFIVILLFSVGFIIFYHFYVNILKEKESIFLIIYPLIPSYMFYKWINVKKYQETWSRYTSAHTKILLEMVKYIYELTPYNEQDRQVQFMNTILMLTDKNVQKFKRNIEKNESKILPEKFQDNEESK